jgi:hypothetical protein
MAMMVLSVSCADQRIGLAMAQNSVGELVGALELVWLAHPVRMSAEVSRNLCTGFLSLLDGFE